MIHLPPPQKILLPAAPCNGEWSLQFSVRARLQRGSAEVGAFQPSSAALNTMGVYTFTNANKQKTAEERKVHVPLMAV